MDPSEIHGSEPRDGSLSEVRNGNISERIEVFNGLGEGKSCILYFHFKYTS